MGIFAKLVGVVKRNFRICISPEKEFGSLDKASLDSVVSDYLLLLFASALAAGLFSLIISVLKSVSFDVFLNMDVDYWRMFNYTAGMSMSRVFVYIFAGTFGAFVATLIIRPFRKLRYTSIVKVTLMALAPFLLFSWITENFLPFLVWGFFLLLVGLKAYPSDHVPKDSISRRD
jgi:hypothetical protein